MATVPSPKLKPSSSAKAEYEDAAASYRAKLAETNSAHERYNTLNAQYGEIHAYHNKITAQIKSEQSTFLRHKQYVVSLSNALLASNTALRSGPKPFSHLQVLTQATLVHQLRDASHTLTNIMVQKKRLDRMEEVACKAEQVCFTQCRDLFLAVDQNLVDLDRLHENVLDGEKKVGREPECGLANGDCESCSRNRDREAGRALAEKTLREVKERASRRVRGRRLDDILEEEEEGDSANT